MGEVDRPDVTPRRVAISGVTSGDGGFTSYLVEI
jgi:hypothetical protein